MQTRTILRNRYRILQKLGSGGFGDTYLAEDGDLPGKPRCVVKHFQPKTNDPAAMPVAKRLFETEAATLYKLGQESKPIPSLFAHFEEGGEFYLVHDYLEGRDFFWENLRSSQNSSALRRQHPRRRQFLSWLISGGMGFGAAVLSGSSSVSRSPIANNPPPSPQPVSPPSKVTTTQTFTTVKVNSRGEIIERLPGEAEVLAENLGTDVTLEMVYIPGGRFLMGSPESEKGRFGNESPQHWVDQKNGFQASPF